MLQGAPAPLLGGILRELAQYTKHHFEREEQALRASGYPGFQAHAREHEKLADQVFEFCEKFDQGRATLSLDLMRFLKDWLAGHILGSDKAYANHLAGGLAVTGARPAPR